MDGKAILVTGSAKRLGSAIAREMHATGANIMVHYHQVSQAAAALVSHLTQQLERA